MGFFVIDELERKKLGDGVHIQVMPGDREMMVFYSIDAGGVIPMHSHPHEQMGMVIEGSIELDIDGERRSVSPGDAYHVRSNILHGGKAGDEPVRVVEVFSPPREDFL